MADQSELNARYAALAARQAELDAERQRLDTERHELRQAQRAAHCALVRANIDTLLAMVPEHGPSSCSDAHPDNAWEARCKRCALLQFKRETWIDPDIEFLVHVEIAANFWD